MERRDEHYNSSRISPLSCIAKLALTVGICFLLISILDLVVIVCPYVRDSGSTHSGSTHYFGSDPFYVRSGVSIHVHTNTSHPINLKIVKQLTEQ